MGFKIEFSPGDFWIGCVFDRRAGQQHIWLNLIPMVSIHLSFKSRSAQRQTLRQEIVRAMSAACSRGFQQGWIPGFELIIWSALIGRRGSRFIRNEDLEVLRGLIFQANEIPIPKNHFPQPGERMLFRYLKLGEWENEFRQIMSTPYAIEPELRAMIDEHMQGIVTQNPTAYKAVINKSKRQV